MRASVRRFGGAHNGKIDLVDRDPVVAEGDSHECVELLSGVHRAGEAYTRRDRGTVGGGESRNGPGVRNFSGP